MGTPYNDDVLCDDVSTNPNCKDGNTKMLQLFIHRIETMLTQQSHIMEVVVDLKLLCTPHKAGQISEGECINLIASCKLLIKASNTK